MTEYQLPADCNLFFDNFLPFLLIIHYFLVKNAYQIGLILYGVAVWHPWGDGSKLRSVVIVKLGEIRRNIKRYQISARPHSFSVNIGITK